ncbi:class I SAM-dependent methyltransferase [Aliarcobacter butzleri]|uniref:class I SAM-dependent methyltransferase n=1 Tax=Aliarcobacter butzleri TaxID=28197 RepID=UPI0021B1DB60|nr:class I SAM-dependent methyltransferase [Aliarcobacter butzleri]MCT7552840.1 class I SAM-dependent methyltransferase [Aliarcobacter butzleri]
MKCRICNENMIFFDKVDDVPLEVTKLNLESNKKIKTACLNIYSCNCCGHYQIKNVLNNDYYEEYSYNVSYSKQLLKLMESEIEYLNKISKNSNNLLEIGCGDGTFLSKANNHFHSCTGYEPSKVFSNLARLKNLHIINDFFPIESDKKKYDTFVSRQVFEHLDDPVALMKSIYDNTTLNCNGLIEIPNGKDIIETGKYFEIFSDHINYFTPKSIIYLIESVGFEIISITKNKEFNYLLVYIKKSQKVNISNVINEHKKLITQAFHNENILVWGGGMKAFSYMRFVNNDRNVLAYFDNDQNKWGKYLPNSSKPIQKVDNEVLKHAELIIIFAITYEKEILTFLKEIEYKNNILSLSYEKIMSFKDLIDEYKL